MHPFQVGFIEPVPIKSNKTLKHFRFCVNFQGLKQKIGKVNVGYFKYFNDVQVSIIDNAQRTLLFMIFTFMVLKLCIFFAFFIFYDHYKFIMKPCLLIYYFLEVY